MLPHSFSHGGAAYEVSFRRMDGQWFAVLCRDSDRSTWPLPPFTDDAVGPLSEHAIRAGYIGLSEWLVAEGRWPDATDLPSLQPPERASVRITKKAEPRLDRTARELIGRELQAMYADVIEQPLPANFVALLGAQESAVKTGTLSNRTVRVPAGERQALAGWAG